MSDKAGPKPKKHNYLFDGKRDGRYVRAWALGRGVEKEIVVQVWNSGKPEGEPDGDWGMPAVLGLTGCVDQAVLQTPKAGGKGT